MQQGLHRKVRRPVEQGSINELRKKLMPSYTLLMSTSDNLRAIAELMTVPNVLCVSMTEDEKLSIKLRPECSENTLLALSKQCVFYGLFGFIVSDTKAGFIAFLNILKAVLCAGCVAGDNDFIGCSLKHSRNAAVGLYAGCISIMVTSFAPCTAMWSAVSAPTSPPPMTTTFSPNSISPRRYL